MPSSTTFEVIALFAVAAMICWPAIRKYLPLPSGDGGGDGERGQRARFEPRNAAELRHQVEAPPLLASPVPDAVYDDEAETAASPARVPMASPPSAGDGTNGSGERAVLPLAEALLLGDRPAAAPAAAPAALADTARNGNATNGTAQPVPPPAPAESGEPQVFRVLLVDEREKFRTAMLLRLARAGHRVFPVTKARDALDVFTRERCDLVLINREAICSVGADFVQRIRATAPYVPILVHGGVPGAGDVGPLKHGVDITVVSTANDDPERLAEMIDCALSASHCIRSVREDQIMRGKILGELCHDLRSALDVISGYTDIMRDAPELNRFQEMLDQMRASTASATAHVQSYVDVALDVADSARQERVELSSVSQKIEKLVESRIGSHPLRLSTTGAVHGSALFTDEEKLLAILAHVITDAIKFTPTGEINIDVQAAGDRTDFTITDAGPGISADAPMLFAAVPPPPDNSDSGEKSGVGLAIAERLSRSIGATLSGTCGEGGAAAFTVSVPAKLITAGETASPTTAQASPTLH